MRDPDSQEFHSDLIKKNKGNTSELWKTLNEFLSKKPNSTVSLIEADGVLHTEKSAIARVPNAHFSLTGTKLATKIKEKLRSAVNNNKKFF